MDHYLQVKEFAVSSVDDVRGIVRVGDIDEIYLPREEEGYLIQLVTASTSTS